VRRFAAAAGRELVGLFVDDGSLALVLIAWVAAAGLLFPYLLAGTQWAAPILLLAGCLAILAENIGRAARRSRG
jgi:hypothetical protein